MTYFKILILTLTITLLGCEHDDICSESAVTTPSVVIDVYDSSNPENKKNVFNLVAKGIGNEAILPVYNNVSTSKLVLPLKTDENSTQYILIKESFLNNNGTPDVLTDDFIDGNYDTITLNYSRKNIFVSRACGYKTIFENVTLTIESDSNNWIKSQEPINPNQSVENETTTHFKLYH